MLPLGRSEERKWNEATREEAGSWLVQERWPQGRHDARCPHHQDLLFGLNCCPESFMEELLPQVAQVVAASLAGTGQSSYPAEVRK